MPLIDLVWLVADVLLTNIEKISVILCNLSILCLAIFIPRNYQGYRDRSKQASSYRNPYPRDHKQNQKQKRPSIPQMLT
jgi:hypothetical protein